jgi:DNA-binding CsgD family transcriptional regulator
MEFGRGLSRDSIRCVTGADAEQGGSAETRLTTEAEALGVELGVESTLQLSRVGDVIVISADTPVFPTELSDSERAVARALIAGSSNAEIARVRGTSVKTVANQLYAMYRKLGVSTREELVARLVDVDDVATEVDPQRS